LVDKASDLPELVYIPFEEAVAEDTLQGWEAEWLLTGRYDAKKWGFLEEPRMDFVYTWVNGSEPAFQTTKRPYELNSTLNDPEGRWRASHGENRYRDWNELKYSVRSVEAYAPFENKIQVLVNSLQHPDGSVTKQVPSWLDSTKTGDVFEVLATEEFFEADKRGCLPTFNSLTIENQLHNTPSETDRVSVSHLVVTSLPLIFPDVRFIRRYAPRATACRLRHVLATIWASAWVQISQLQHRSCTESGRCTPVW
jgi:hypothetical protein